MSMTSLVNEFDIIEKLINIIHCGFFFKRRINDAS